MRGSITIITFCLLSMASPGSPDLPDSHPSSNAFGDAVLAPPDVSIFVHISDAGRLRQGLATRPLGRWLTGLLSEGQIGRAWSRLARAGQVEEDHLFDLVFGREVCLFARGSNQVLEAKSEGGLFFNLEEWVLIAQPEAEPLAQLFRTLHLRHHPPQLGISVRELPEQQLLIAFNGERLVVGPTHNPGLFSEVLGRMASVRPDSLQSSNPFRMIRERLPAGRIGIYLKHESPLGGWSALSGDLEGEVMKIRIAGRYDHPPFSRPRTHLIWSAELLEAFADRSLVAVIEPTDIGAGPGETFLEVVVGRPFLCDALRENPGETRLLVVGEVEGRRESPPVDLLLPSVTLVVEASDEQNLESRADAHMINLARALPALIPGADALVVPALDSLKPGVNRHLSLAPFMQRFAGGWPLLEHVSLNWRLVRGEGGNYFVSSTHPLGLEEAVETLGRARRHRGERGRWSHCGVANGVRLGSHLRSYSDRPEGLTEEADAESFRKTLRMLSDLASGVQQCRWRLSRPTDQELFLEVEVHLTPPDSSGEE